MKKLFAVLLAGAIAVGAIGCNKTTEGNAGANQGNAGTSQENMASEVKTMSGQELVDLMADDAKMGETIIVDVRKTNEFEEGHIEGAINIPLEEIEGNLPTLEAFKDKTVVFYCNTGNRSGKAGKILVDNGYANVFNADGVKDFKYELVSDK